MKTRKIVRLLAPVLALTGSAAAAAADEYQFVPVQAFPGLSIPECYLRGINNAGMAVGTATITVQDAQGNLHGVYTGMTWTMGGGKTAFDGNSYPTGISNTGWVSGLGAVSYLPTGQTYVPPTLPGTFGGAKLWAINDAGIAVGSIQTCVCSNSAGLQQVVYIWDAAAGARTIGVAGAKELVAINNSNVAVGNIRSDAVAGVGDAFVYDLGTGQTTILSTVLPQPPAGVVYKVVASDINDAGQVTGYFRENTTGHNTGFVWSSGTGAVLLSPPAGASYLQDVRPAAINNAGVVVGVLGLAAGGTRPFVYDSAHGVRDLATLTTVAPFTFNYWYASSVNDHGWITAYGYTGSGFASAVLRPLAACAADWDHSGSVAPADVSAFVNAWLADLGAGTLAADFDGNGAVQPADVAAFLNAWFAALNSGC